jgi:hypothetical protein
VSAKLAILGHSRAYTAQAAALFARMSTPPTVSRARLIDTVIRILIAQGIWSTLDALYLTAGADSQAASLNWVSSSHNLTAVNSPTFTADRGFQGNGTTSYLDTNLLPGASATINSHAIGAYMNLASTAGGYLGISSGSFVGVSFAGFTVSSGAGTISIVQANTLGYAALTRASSTVFTEQRNSTQTGQTQTTTGNFSADDYLLLKGAGALCDGRIAAAHVGGALTTAQLTIMQQQIAYYLTAVGGA